MIHKKPEGYKDLLAYQKAAETHRLTVALTSHFPKTKNMFNLKDQMDRSGRSGSKNIVEGWKRNTTKEYFDFLGFSIAAVEELKDDYADIAKGVYPELMKIPELWKDRDGGKGSNGSNGDFVPINPIQPFNPFLPVKPFTESQLTSLRFYPLDESLPLVVQNYLRTKEVLMLLDKLQRSLDIKMDKDMTRPPVDRARMRIQQYKKEGQDVKRMIEASGLIQLENGQWVKGEKGSKRDNL